MTKDHKCYNGKIFTDSSRTSMIPCPICQEQRIHDSRDGVLGDDGKQISLAEKLGVNKRYVTDIYNDEHIIGKADIYYLEPKSLHDFNDYTNRLIGNLVLGVLPTHSLMMYLGRHAKLQEFAYILLASAHKGVLTVGKVLTPREIRLNKYDPDFQDNYTTDLSVVIMTDVADRVAHNEVSSYMADRAYKGKPTIILISSRQGFKSLINRFCSLDDERLDLSLYLGVSYKRDLDMDKENILISSKAFQVSNTHLGTQQELEDQYKIPTREVIEGYSQQELLDPNEGVQSIDLDKLTNQKFDGR